MIAVHDSFDSFFRSPFGAVCAGAEVRLSLFLNISAEVGLHYWLGNEPHILNMQARTYNYSGKAGYLYSCTLTLPDKPGLVWYCFEIMSNGEKKYYCGTHGEGFLTDKIECSYQITVYKPYVLPDWYKHAIVYQIFPDRFARGRETGGLSRVYSHTNRGQDIYIHMNWSEEVNFLPRTFEDYYKPCDFFCGDLKGIEENIDYLRSLNISCIYLNPIFDSPSNHRYDTSDYMSVDEILGGDGAFYSLRAAAENAGIHIMLDGVFSHTGADSIYFNKYKHFASIGAANSKESDFYTWYDFSDYPEGYKSWWGFGELPEVNEDDLSYRSYIAEAVDKWHVSWRLDVADELTDDFIRFFRQRVKKDDPQAVVIGEVWEDASDKFSKGKRRGYTDGDLLDGVMNYPLRQWICDFVLGKINANELVFKLKCQRENYPEEFLKGSLNLLSSHDTVRILTVLCGAPGRDELCVREQQKVVFSGAELTKGIENVIMAISLQFIMYGVPCIYYGDEQGMQGMADPFCRRPFKINYDDDRIFKKYAALCKLRSTHRSFEGLEELSSYTEDIVIIRRYKEDSCTYCIVNRAETQAQIIIRTQEETGVYNDALGGDIYCVYKGIMELTLRPRSAVMLYSL